MSDWNSNQYTKFEKERTQPSIDLINRIDIVPESILDIGCGPGNSTRKLSEFFPGAQILGIDSSDDMLAKAAGTHPGLKFRKCLVPEGLDDLGCCDLIFSNACLHWIPDHEVLLPKLMSKLNPGGVLAVQMPLTRDAVFYRMLDELTASGKWAKLGAIQNFHNLTPGETYDILSRCSGEVTMWETVYYHIVPTHESVIEWYKGSGLRPYLDALGEEEREPFLRELLALVKSAYPIQADGSVILKIPRLFFTAAASRRRVAADNA